MPTPGEPQEISQTDNNQDNQTPDKHPIWQKTKEALQKLPIIKNLTKKARTESEEGNSRKGLETLAKPEVASVNQLLSAMSSRPDLILNTRTATNDEMQLGWNRKNASSR